MRRVIICQSHGVHPHFAHVHYLYIEITYLQSSLPLFVHHPLHIKRRSFLQLYTRMLIGIHSYTNTQRNLYILTTKFLPCRNRAEESRAVYRNTYYFIRRVCCCVLFYVILIHAFFFFLESKYSAVFRGLHAVLDPFFSGAIYSRNDTVQCTPVFT